MPALKARLQEASGVAAERQRIIFRGHVLQDDQNLSDYGADPLVPARKAPNSQSSASDGTALDA